MKKIIQFAFLSIILFVSSCSKDLGNYDYQDVNDVNIVDGVLTSDHNTGRIYRIPFGEELNIVPKYEGSISGSDLSNLDFKWTIDNKVISTESDLNYLANEKYGKLVGQLQVTDKTTSIVKTYAFFVEIINKFKSGYYFLAEKSNKDAVLYCISSISEDMSLDEISMPSFPNLGKEPLYLSGVTKYGNSSTDFWNVITLGVKNSQYPVAIIESKEFKPFRFYNSSSYVGDGVFNFVPSGIISDTYSSSEVVYAINNGKLHILSKGGISEPKFSSDQLDYEIPSNGIFRPTMIFSANAYNDKFMAFFDVKNSQVRLITNTVGLAFDFTVNHNIQTTPNQLEGHKFLSGSYYIVSPNIVFTFLTQKDNKLYLYEGKVGISNRVSSPIEEIGSVDLPSSNPISKIYFNENQRNYYLSSGKTIYRLQNTAINKVLALDEYIKLSSEVPGDISDFSFGTARSGLTNTNLLSIVTYDSSAEGDKKSSIAIYNTQDLTMFHLKKHALEAVKGIYVGL